MHAPALPSPKARALAALTVVQLLFGTLGPIGKIALPVFGAPGVALARILGGAVVFGALRLAMGQPRAPRALQPRLALCAFIGVVANQLLFLEGLSRTSAVHATLLVTTTPVFTLLAGALLHRERPRAQVLAGVMLSLGGVGLLVGPKLGTGALLGDLLILANTALYATYLVISRPLLAQLPPITVAAGLFAWAAPMVLLVRGFSWPEAPAPALWALGWIVLGPTVGTYLLNLMALRQVPATLVGLFISLQPFVAAALALPLLGEVPGPREALAAALSLGGIVLASRASA